MVGVVGSSPIVPTNLVTARFNGREMRKAASSGFFFWVNFILDSWLCQNDPAVLRWAGSLYRPLLFVFMEGFSIESYSYRYS